MSDQKDFPSDRADKFVVRLPDGMRDRIKAEADNNKRSMNAEIIARLEQSLKLPAMVDRIMESFKTIDAGHNEKDALMARMAEMIEAQKLLSDQQENIINQLLKAMPDTPTPDKK